MNNCDTQSENCSSSTVGGWWSSSHKLDSWVYVPVKYIARIASWQLFLQRCKFCCSSYSCKPLTDILPLLSGPIAYNIHFSHWSTVSFLLIFTNVEIFLFTNAEIVLWQSLYISILLLFDTALGVNLEPSYYYWISHYWVSVLVNW